MDAFLGRGSLLSAPVARLQAGTTVKARSPNALFQRLLGDSMPEAAMDFPAFSVSGEYGAQVEGINTNDHEKGHSNQHMRKS